MKLHIEHGYLEYELSGSGIPLLFIHGYPLSRQIWASQYTELASQANVITLDLRGHGESFSFEGPYTMDMLAEDCKKLLDTLVPGEKVVICGHSMGGYITMALYKKHPELFNGIILTSTRPEADSPEAIANREASIKNVLAKGTGAIADGMLPKIVAPATLTTQPELVSKIRTIMEGTSVVGIVGALQAIMKRSDSTSLLPGVTCPTLIIHGLDDQLIPVKEADLMHELISDSRLVKVAGAGHLPCMEQPDLFNQAIGDFLTTLR